MRNLTNTQHDTALEPESGSGVALESDSLTRGMAILHMLARCGTSRGLTQIAGELSLAKSTTHRLLKTLGRLGFISQHPETQRYAANASLFALMYSWTHAFGPNARLHYAIRHAAQECGPRASIFLSMLSGRSTYVISAAGPFGDTQALGSECPVHASSAGKVIVSGMPEETWGKYAPKPDFPKRTPLTDLDPDHFLEAVRAARQEGVAWNLGQSSEDAYSVAAPVQELSREHRLAVALVIPSQDYAQERRAELAQRITQIAERISSILRLESDHFASLVGRKAGVDFEV